MIDKPCSPSCDRNREPILAVLRRHFTDRRAVLEIGSGTGQHAVCFAQAMPWLTWQCSDRAEYLPGIGMWLEEAALANTPAPVALDVATRPWPLLPLPLAGEGWGEGVQNRPGDEAQELCDERRRPLCARPHPAFGHLLPQAGEGHSGFDAAFSANTLHIMGWPEVEAFFAGLDGALADDATLVVYGPFNYDGAYSSDSNRQFDGWLKARDSRSGIRDFEAVDALARAIGMRLVDDVAMPANNRCLVWTR